VPSKAALRAIHAPPRDGRLGSWCDWLGRLEMGNSTHRSGVLIRKNTHS
jgi:hypothetical protein